MRSPSKSFAVAMEYSRQWHDARAHVDAHWQQPGVISARFAQWEIEDYEFLCREGAHDH